MSRLSGERPRGLGLERRGGRHFSRNVVVEVVSGLEVEEPLALMTANEGLVTVVTEALATVFQLFSQGETAELADRRQSRRRRGRRRPWRGRQLR